MADRMMPALHRFMDMSAIGRKAFIVEKLDDGALPIYGGKPLEETVMPQDTSEPVDCSKPFGRLRRFHYDPLISHTVLPAESMEEGLRADFNHDQPSEGIVPTHLGPVEDDLVKFGDPTFIGWSMLLPTPDFPGYLVTEGGVTRVYDLDGREIDRDGNVLDEAGHVAELCGDQDDNNAHASDGAGRRDHLGDDQPG